MGRANNGTQVPSHCRAEYFIRWPREHLIGSHEDHPGVDVALTLSVPPVAVESPAEVPTTLFDAGEGIPMDGIAEVWTNEFGLKTILGLEELFEDHNSIDACVPYICPVAHADVRAAEPVPLVVAVKDESTSEVVQIVDGRAPDRAAELIRKLVTQGKVTQKIMCHAKSTKLYFLLRPDNGV